MKYKVSIPILISILFLVGCQKKNVSGNGKVSEAFYAVSDFNSISLKGAFEIHLLQDTAPYVKLIADENIIPEINISVSDSSLDVYPLKNIVRSKELKLIISCRDVNSIILSGASEILSDSVLKFNTLNMNISGTGRIVLNTVIQNLSINISGGADVLLSGQCEKLNVSITGIGKIDSQKLPTKNTSVDISGYGRALLNASEQLNINISGFGKVSYQGDPVIKQNITGNARIFKME